MLDPAQKVPLPPSTRGHPTGAPSVVHARVPAQGACSVLRVGKTNQTPSPLSTAPGPAMPKGRWPARHRAAEPRRRGPGVSHLQSRSRVSGPSVGQLPPSSSPCSRVPGRPPACVLCSTNRAGALGRGPRMGPLDRARPRVSEKATRRPFKPSTAAWLNARPSKDWI